MRQQSAVCRAAHVQPPGAAGMAAAAAPRRAPGHAALRKAVKVNDDAVLNARPAGRDVVVDGELAAGGPTRQGCKQAGRLRSQPSRQDAPKQAGLRAARGAVALSSVEQSIGCKWCCRWWAAHLGAGAPPAAGRASRRCTHLQHLALLHLQGWGDLAVDHHHGPLEAAAAQACRRLNAMRGTREVGGTRGPPHCRTPLTSRAPPAQR